MKMSPVPPAPTATIALTGRLGRSFANSCTDLHSQGGPNSTVGNKRVFCRVSKTTNGRAQARTECDRHRCWELHLACATASGPAKLHMNSKTDLLGRTLSNECGRHQGRELHSTVATRSPRPAKYELNSKAEMPGALFYQTGQYRLQYNETPL